MRNSLLGCQGCKNIPGRWRGSCERWGHDLGLQGIEESSKERVSTQHRLGPLHDNSLTQGTPLDHSRAPSQIHTGWLILMKDKKVKWFALKEHTRKWQSYDSSPGVPDSKKQALFSTFWFSRRPPTKDSLSWVWKGRLRNCIACFGGNSF